MIGSELVQKYVGEGARMVRELFEMARSKKACLIFFDEIDAVGGARHDDGQGGDNEVQRTMLELINQLDGFDARGNIKVLMATNRPDTLDPALLRPGRLDRKIEFGPPDLDGRAHIFKIHARSMSTERDIRFELLSRTATSTLLYTISRMFTNPITTCHLPVRYSLRWAHVFRVLIRACNSVLCRIRGCRALPQRHGRRHPQRLHRGWDVRHPGPQEDRDREGLPRCGQQGDQGAGQVQLDRTLHDLQLNGARGTGQGAWKRTIHRSTARSVVSDVRTQPVGCWGMVPLPGYCHSSILLLAPQHAHK